jgi:histidyl-tRNA synthetase
VLGGGRYDGLIENLGGPATPAVGWAAGIERLAMLVDHVSLDKFDAVIVVENDDRLADAIRLARKLRAAKFGTEIVATGSPRKRFDKAAKLSSHTLISLSVADGTPSMRIRGEGSDIAARVEAFIVAAN